MNTPNDNHPQSELDILEGMFNHMFNGTMTMLFKTLQEPSFVEIIDPTTVLSTSQPAANHQSITELDGSDFKRIAQKRRQKTTGNNEENDNTQTVITTPIDNNINNNINNNQRQQQIIDDITIPSSDHRLHNVISIFNRDHQLENNNNIHHDLFSMLFGKSNQSNNNDSMTYNDNQSNGWTFSSSSMTSQRHIHPDGTEETTTTTKRNGITETVTRIKYPDGSVEEIKHVGGGNNNNNLINSPGLLTPSSSLPSITTNSSPINDTTTTAPSNILSRFFKSIWG